MLNLTYTALALTTTTTICCRRRKVLYAGIIISTIVAIEQHFLSIGGAATLAGVAALVYAYYNLPSLNFVVKNIILLILVALVTELLLHNLSVFGNIILVDSVSVSPLSQPYTMYFNIDKIMTALIIYAISYLSVNERHLDSLALKQTLFIFLVLLVVIITPALLTGYVHFDPKIPQIMPIWFVNNLLFVCFSEEVIFRGFLQNIIISYLPRKGIFIALAIIVTSIIFGLFHFRDGTTYMVLAGVCGLFYGYTYYKTKRILCAMLVHFLLNFTHFTLFTYPSAL